MVWHLQEIISSPDNKAIRSPDPAQPLSSDVEVSSAADFMIKGMETRINDEAIQRFHERSHESRFLKSLLLIGLNGFYDMTLRQAALSGFSLNILPMEY